MAEHTDPPEARRPIHQSREERIKDLGSMPLFQDLLPSGLVHFLVDNIPPAEIFPSDIVFFRQGDKGEASNYLYIVSSGHLLQWGNAPDGRPWLERELTRGDAFGRYALFTGKPQETTVQAKEGGLVYRVPADVLREALIRWPALQSRLIPEERIHRLRGVPVYGVLPDDHIRRLADHIVEKRLAPGELYRKAPDASTTVWVVVKGQGGVAEVGTEPPPLLWESETISLVTVGYTFVDAYAQGFPPPQQLRAISEVVLYGLPLKKFERLAELFAPPAVGEETPPHPLLSHLYPSQAANLLRAALDPEGRVPKSWWPLLVGFVAWIFSPRFQVLTRQGETSGDFYLLVEGEAIVRAVDERGRRRPRNYLFPLNTFGRSSLLLGVVHDATVESTQPSYWLRLTREDLSRFNRYIMNIKARTPLAARIKGKLLCFVSRQLEHIWPAARDVAREECPPVRSIWQYLGGKPPLVERFVEKKVGWKEPHERLLWMERRHPAFFVLSVFPYMLAFAISVLLLAIVIMGELPSSLLGPFAIFSLLIGVILAYRVYDYTNDFYAVTDRRVIHREQVLPIRDVWEEAPLERVQDMRLQRSFFGRLLNYGTVEIKTAATGGGIRMENIPNPDRVVGLINEARARLRTRRRARQREHLRADLQRRLFVNVLADWPALATGDHYPLDRGGSEFPEHSAAPSDVLYIPWAPKIFWRVGNTFYWRKHYIRLLTRVTPAVLLWLLSTALLFFMWRSVPERWTQAHPGMWYGTILVALLFFLFSLGFIVWRYDDWRNDLYILMPDRIIDLEKKPFFVEEERRTATLDRVQDTRVERKGPFAYFFNYGTVVVQTAAQDGNLYFRHVANPLGVARHIAEAREAYQRRQEQREMERQRELLAEGIEVYDEILRGRLPRIRRRWYRDDL